MPQFMIAYHGGDHPASKEEGMKHMERWKAWLQGLGDDVINPGTPLGDAKIVTSDTVQDDKDSAAMNGFSVITAENMEKALEAAKSCPFLAIGGSLRVSQMREMNF